MTPPFFAALTEALTEAVKYNIRYNTRDDKGETRAERNARFHVPELTPEAPEIPDQVEHVWNWFWEISGQRSSGMADAEPIAWRDISEWSRLTGNSLHPEELRMLIEMDAAFRSALADERKPQEETQEPERLQKPPT